MVVCVWVCGWEGWWGGGGGRREGRGAAARKWRAAATQARHRRRRRGRLAWVLLRHLLGVSSPGMYSAAFHLREGPGPGISTWEGEGTGHNWGRWHGAPASTAAMQPHTHATHTPSRAAHLSTTLPSALGQAFSRLLVSLSSWR